MKKNGFTLIELIAVITLLSLIVLISVPVIINTLNKTEQNEYEDFERLVVNAAELYLERNRDLYSFNNIGDSIDITGNTLINEGYLKNDLENPIDNTSVSKYKIVATVGQDEIFEYKLMKIKKLSEIVTTSTNNCIQEGNVCSETDINAGISVNVKVNDTEAYNFYVISDNGEEVTLIMDRNLGDNVVWYADADNNSYGPTTAVAALKERTSNWANILGREYTYSDDGGGNKYTAFTEKMRARMLTYTEATGLGCDSDVIKSCPSWLYENLYTTGDDTGYKLGYWTSTAYASDSTCVHTINHDGIVICAPTNISGNGLRPVITVSRSL